MQLPLILIIILIILALVIVVFADWLALRIFGLKTARTNLAKIVSVEILVTLAASAVTSKGPGLVNLLFFIVDVAVWVLLIKRYITDKYSLGKAIGSYLVSYLFIFAFSLVVAIVMLGSFVQTFDISGNSMAPALNNNDKALVYKFEKHPSKNQIIVYRTDTGTQALGRVRGTPGQWLCNVSGQVKMPVQNGNGTEIPCSLNAGQYLVTVDNASYNIPPRIINSSSIVGTIGPKL